ncbi:hypothetical protein RI129_003280 [Pyrocoelia pectoralis]|uniref:Gag-like protein n=1 Tax=Pyrocoelia pectoralis TaxID=417401 RepID=A0AAN7VR12_9COLE
MGAVVEMEADIGIQSMECPPPGTDIVVNAITNKMEEMRAHSTPSTLDIANAVSNAIADKMEVLQAHQCPSSAEIAQAVTNAIGDKVATDGVAQPTSHGVSYASMVKVPTAMQVTPTIPPRQHSIVVFPDLPPGRDPPTSTETRKRIMEVLKPAETGLQIAAVRNMGRSGAILIATTSEAAKDELMRHPALTSEGLRTEAARTDRPRIKIYDVPKEMDAVTIAQAIRRQNTEDITPTEFTKQFKIVHIFPSKVRNNVAIAECAPDIRQRLLQQGRVYIDFESCRVLDHIQVTRCFKCQAYGHPAKYCTAAADTCSVCAGQHFHTACTHKDSPQEHKCANCLRAKMGDTAHPAISVKCPAYIRALETSIRKTDYGTR